jgi:hypothetical protein
MMVTGAAAAREAVTAISTQSMTIAEKRLGM